MLPRSRRLWSALLLLAVVTLAIPGVLDAKQTSGIDPGQQMVVEQIAGKISTVEWLAPLAPIALSPFFGITLLSGLACYGPEWLPDNGLFSEHSPFANPWVFWTFLFLTIATSLPRLSKVSKPLAQMADFIETYSAIIILVAMKVMSSISTGGEAETAMVVHAGFVDVGVDTLVAIAMAVNIFVVNAVKFFFEFLVWVTPIPLLDAVFELSNKALCAGLMAIYAFNPFVALLINVVLFTICLYLFGWMRRRELFFRTVVTDMVLGWFNKSRSSKIPDVLTVFPAYDIGPIKRRSKCSLSNSRDGLRLTQRRWLRSPLQVDLEGGAGERHIDDDWWTNTLALPGGVSLTFSSRYNDNLENLAKKFGAVIHEASSKSSDPKFARQIEFN